MGALPRAATPIVLTLASVVIGAAASLGLASDSLGAATAGTPRCTSAGLTVTPVLSGSTVASVTVAGLPSGCGGAVLQVAANNGSANGSGSGTVPAGGGSVTVALGTAPGLTTNLQADLLITGP
ncbi:MAG TPA: hypothetical protein VEY67_01915 [Candidatus Dormibacteraeota bacterium]|nr:hypothetical protein [Candidatus Dormibacteraeota bacterium]